MQDQLRSPWHMGNSTYPIAPRDFAFASHFLFLKTFGYDTPEQSVWKNSKSRPLGPGAIGETLKALKAVSKGYLAHLRMEFASQMIQMWNAKMKMFVRC